MIATIPKSLGANYQKKGRGISQSIKDGGKNGRSEKNESNLFSHIDLYLLRIRYGMRCFLVGIKYDGI